METSFALTGKGYVIVAADTVAARSIVKMKSDEDKIKVLSPHLLMSYSGEPGTYPFSDNSLSSLITLRTKAILSTLQNFSNATSASTKYATCTPLVHRLRHLGFDVH